MDKIIQIIAAGIGSLGFALLFNIKGKDLFWASLAGFLDWAVYILAFIYTKDEYQSYFFASLFLGLYSQIISRRNKAPATIYHAVGFIPLIPGRSLFLTMENLFTTDWENVLKYGANSVNIAIAISGGIALEIIFTRIYDFYRVRRKNDL